MRDSRTVLTCPLSIYKRIYSRLFIHEYLAWQQLHPMTPMRYIVLKTLSEEHAQCFNWTEHLIFKNYFSLDLSIIFPLIIVLVLYILLPYFINERYD